MLDLGVRVGAPGGVRLALDRLRLNGGTQPRESISQGVVRDYREGMEAGAVFPPVVAFFDGTDCWLADGFHRVLAAQVAGLPELAVDVRSGSREDAVWFAAAANATHGHRRTNADKRRAVEMALRSVRARGLSDRAIAAHCGVTDKTVASVRAALEASAEIPQFNERTGLDGRVRRSLVQGAPKAAAEQPASESSEATPPLAREAAPEPAPGPPAPSLVLALFELPPHQPPRKQRPPTLRRVLGAALGLSHDELLVLRRQLDWHLDREDEFIADAAPKDSDVG